MLTDLSASHPGLQAITDRLTGLYNRSAFDEHFSLALLSGHVFSLALLDIDQFRSYNDAFGQVAGSEVLKQIARIMAHHLRAGDVLARYDSDKFIILLPQTPAPTALNIAERLRKQVAQSVWPLRQITISCGVTTRLPGEQVQGRENKSLGDAIIRRTDQALRRAKDSGRNRAIHTDSLSTNLAYDPSRASQILTDLESHARKLREQDIEQAIQTSKRAVEIAQARSKDNLQAQVELTQSLFNLGDLYYQQGDYYQALQNLLQAIDLLKAAPAWPLHGQILRTVITVYAKMSEYPTALRYCLELNAMAKQEGDFAWRAKAFIWIAYVLMRMENWRQAADYLERGLKIVQEHAEPESYAMLFDHLCNCYTALGEHTPALQAGQRAVGLARQTGQRKLEAQCLYSLGQALAAQSDTPGALACLDECNTLCQANDLKDELIHCLQSIAAIHQRHSQPSQALQQLQRALKLAEESGARREQYQIHRQMAEIYKAQGKTDAALAHFEQFYLIYEGVQGEETELRIKNLQAVHELAITRQEAEMQRRKNLELQGILEQQERLIDDLNAFAYTVAHDLKTPIATLSIGIDLMGRVERGKLSPQGLEILEKAAATTRHMSAITDELLLLASVREQEVEMRPLDMPQIVARVETRLQILIGEHQAEVFKPEAWPVALGYTPWIEEVWVNYLSNAIKYGGRPPQATLGGELLPDGRAQFWVKDNGNGLSQEEIRQLFQPFQRLSQVETQGYGLGLPIVRRILEKLGGEVGAESAGIAGQGCKFTFTLPATE